MAANQEPNQSELDGEHLSAADPLLDPGSWLPSDLTTGPGDDALTFEDPLSLDGGDI